MYPLSTSPSQNSGRLHHHVSRHSFESPRGVSVKARSTGRGRHGGNGAAASTGTITPHGYHHPPQQQQQQQQQLVCGSTSRVAMNQNTEQGQSLGVGSGPCIADQLERLGVRSVRNSLDSSPQGEYDRDHNEQSTHATHAHRRGGTSPPTPTAVGSPVKNDLSFQIGESGGRHPHPQQHQQGMVLGGGNLSISVPFEATTPANSTERGGGGGELNSPKRRKQHPPARSRPHLHW
jgi:hypothetical protein